MVNEGYNTKFEIIMDKLNLIPKEYSTINRLEDELEKYTLYKEFRVVECK